MLATITGHAGHTNHAVDRDGTAALCRASLKPRMWPVYGENGRWVRDAVSIHKLPGDDFSRSCDVNRVTCLPCLRKLAKLTAEAFDAAAVQDAARTAELDNHVDHRVHDLAEAFVAASAQQAARHAGDGARILVADEGGCLAVWVDSGFGLRLAATVPTGSRAAYPEAIERGMAEACRRVAAVVADYVGMYPDAVVIGWTDRR